MPPHHRLLNVTLVHNYSLSSLIKQLLLLLDTAHLLVRYNPLTFSDSERELTLTFGVSRMSSETYYQSARITPRLLPM